MSVTEDQIYQLMLKMGQDDGPGDTDESVEGFQADAYPTPSDDGQKEDGTTNASWGQSDIKPNDPAGTAVHHSNAVWDEFARGREKFLQRHFDAYGTSQDTNQAVLGQNLQHAKSGDYEASSAMVQEGSDRKPAVAETLVDKTKKVLDTY